MEFITSNKIDKWVENHRKKCISHATAGEQFIYIIPYLIFDVNDFLTFSLLS